MDLSAVREIERLEPPSKVRAPTFFRYRSAATIVGPVIRALPLGVTMRIDWFVKEMSEREDKVSEMLRSTPERMVGPMMVRLVVRITVNVRGN